MAWGGSPRTSEVCWDTRPGGSGERAGLISGEEYHDMFTVLTLCGAFLRMSEACWNIRCLFLESVMVTGYIN